MEHPSIRHGRAVHAAERCAESHAYCIFGIADVIRRAEKRAARARTREAQLRLRRLADALHDVAMRGEPRVEGER